MKMAEDFEGSDVQRALIEIGKIKVGETSGQTTPQAQPSKPQAAPQQAPQEPMEFDQFDDDIPF
ncbi:hypothetical protein D3C75_539910 [compost metagenome]